MNKDKLLSTIKGGLIVSCQALEDEPLHSPFIMGRMALAAQKGGAVGIRANSYDDIIEIKKQVHLPVIGIVKNKYADSEVFITPTIDEVEEVIRAGADIVASDARDQIRPENQTLEDFYYKVRKQYGNVVLMADISTYEEGVKAQELGFDIVATTLSAFAPFSEDTSLPNITLLQSLVQNLDIPVMAEGGIWTIEDLQAAMDAGAFASVVGTAITRPMEITKRFVCSIKS